MADGSSGLTRLRAGVGSGGHLRATALRLVGVLIAALATGALVVAISGLEPVATGQAIFEGAFGTKQAISNTLITTIPITLTALGVAVAYRAGLFNIGGEGQIYIGALCAILVALAGKHAGGAVLIPAVLIAGLLGGAIWGGIAGALRARLGLSELITTIMLNYIALWIVSYLVRGPIQDNSYAALGYPQSSDVAGGAQLGQIGGWLPVGVFLVGAAAIAVWVYIERSMSGLGLQAVGEAPAASRFAGMPVSRYQFATLAAAGALAGLGGATELLGNQHHLSDSFTPGWGYDALAVALLARGRVAGTILVGLFVGALRAGVLGAQAEVPLDQSLAQLLQGIAMLYLLLANADLLAPAVKRALLRRRAVRTGPGTPAEASV